MAGVVNILVCDDNVTFTQHLVNFLLKNDENIRICGIVYNAMEALNIVEQCNPDLIILDLKMPTMSGYDFLEKLNEIESFSGIVIIVTGIQCNVTNLLKYEYVNDVIFKGITYKEIMERIGAILIKKSQIHIKKRILSELVQFGFNKESKSTRCLLKAICISIFDENDCRVMKNVFKQLEKEEQVQYRDIMSNIQKAIDLIWLNSNQEGICKKFKITLDTKPTVKIVLYYFVDKYRSYLNSNNVSKQI